MPKQEKNKRGLWAFLDSKGLLENGTEEQIRTARKEYRRIYLTEYKKNQRKDCAEFSVLLLRQNGEYNRILAAARRHKLSIPAFLKNATCAYISKTFIVPDRSVLVRLVGMLADCLNEIQQIANGGDQSYWLVEQKYDAIEKRVVHLEEQISALLSNPLDLEGAVRSAITKDTDLRLRLLLLLTSAINPTTA